MLNNFIWTYIYSNYERYHLIIVNVINMSNEYGELVIFLVVGNWFCVSFNFFYILYALLWLQKVQFD